MSEELLQKGYLRDDQVRGHPVGPYEGFNLGATTVDQLRRYRIVPDLPYGKHHKNKPDAIVVDRRPDIPVVKFVAEYKDRGVLGTADRLREVSEKLADQYCRPLRCELGGLSDHFRHSWLLITPQEWRTIRREDAYELDAPIDLADDDGRDLLARTLARLEQNLDKHTGTLKPVEAVNPTRLAEQTWQDIWLACGEEPEGCLATFVEILIFKFLSDIGILRTNPAGIPVDFETVLQQDADHILKYYFDTVRSTIKDLFPLGTDGTSVINGIVLDPRSTDQGRLFRQVLQRFASFGSLRRIDPEFKSRIFERFLKKSLAVKNWGQYFTPRNVVKAMVEMSGVEHLPPGAVLADPACGVGGFLLEPLMNKRPHDYRSPSHPGLRYLGWDRDDKTIILAKANMLVHLSEALEEDPHGALSYIAPALNDSFEGMTGNLTGSLGAVPEEEFDLVMTNPPYVTKGTRHQREFLDAHTGYYNVPGAGVENLFTQLIINGLRRGALALMIVPDGLLLRHSEDALRAHILRTCILEAIVSLPMNTFYSTPKKTYILVLRRKQRDGDPQTHPVFTYLVSEIGETLDAKRFTIPENNLPDMAAQFRLFQGNPTEFSSIDPRCRVVPIEEFDPEEHWLVNKWWPRDEREHLGDIEPESFVAAGEMAAILADAATELEDHTKALGVLEQEVDVGQTVTLELSDTRYFRMSIGKRVLKKDLFRSTGGSVSLYSANVEPGHEHGWVAESNINDFSRPSILWSIDSDFAMSVRTAGDVFATTDHCGRLEILSEDLDPHYCQAAIVYGYGRTYGFDRVTRPSLRRMRKVTLRVPVLLDGAFDAEAQRILAEKYTAIHRAVEDVRHLMGAIMPLKARADLPRDAEDRGLQLPAEEARRRREDEQDARIAQDRLNEICEHPSHVVTGKKLETRLADLVG